MENYEVAFKLITTLKEKLTDADQKKYFDNVADSLTTAKDMIGDSEEKEARIEDAAIKFVNQLAFILFRNGTITEEETETFRTLPAPEETSKVVRKFEEAHQAKIDEINEKQQAIMDERKELDLFLAIISGMSKEEAEKRIAQYEAQIAEATKQ